MTRKELDVLKNVDHPETVKIAKELIDIYDNLDITKIPTYKSSRLPMNIPVITGYYPVTYLTIPYAFLMQEEQSKKLQIKPVDYNIYGVKQKWVKLELSLNQTVDGKKKIIYDSNEYNKIEKIKKEYFKNGINYSNIIPDSHISITDSIVDNVKYINPSNKTKSELKKETYDEKTQELIREKIDIIESIDVMYEYIDSTQNNEFKAYVDEIAKKDQIKGYIISDKDYSTLIEEFKRQLKNTSGEADTKVYLRVRDDEDQIADPEKIKIKQGRVNFDQDANELVTILFRGLGNVDKENQREYYKNVRRLGRKIIQEEEEIDQYVGIGEHMKGLPTEEIIDIHNRYQIDKLSSYVTNLYQAANLLNYIDDKNQMYDTSQGKYLIQFVGKIKPDIKKIESLVSKINSPEMRKQSPLDQIHELFKIFKNVCYTIIENSKEGSRLIKLSLIHI